MGGWVGGWVGLPEAPEVPALEEIVCILDHLGPASFPLYHAELIEWVGRWVGGLGRGERGGWNALL